MTGEIRNPAKLPTNLNPAEEKFARCLAGGEPCIIGDGALPKKGIESGEGANMVRSEVIRFFAYGGNEDNPVLGSMLSLRGAWISGDLDLTYASIPYALTFSNCHFVASVLMEHAECTGLYLNGSSLAEGLNADGLTTKGDVYLQNGFSAKGEVRLPGANIGGDLTCVDGKFHNPRGYALIANGLSAKGSVYLSDGFSAEGEVRLLGANIGGSLSCVDGKFYNLGRQALNADGLTTKGNVNLRGKFSAKGEVRLLNANISGDLDCVDGKFHNPDGKALSADGLTTTGGVYLRGSFSAEGEVRLLSASIGGHLDCQGGKFHNPDGNALIVDGGNIIGGLLWKNIICAGDVHLAYARADVLADDSKSWESCKVNLDGFTYNRFSNPMDASFRINWLANRPDGMGFSPQPYEQAAKVLFRMGHIHNARETLLEKERRQTKDGKSHLQWKILRWFWNVSSGYGYRLRYTAAWIALLIYVGALVFAVADRYGNIVPTHPVVTLSEGYKKKISHNCGLRPTQAVEPEYPAFHAVMFSVDVFMPSSPFHQEDSWAPRSGGGDWLTFWYWFEIFMGWLLSSLILLSGTDFLRLQSSSKRD